VPSPPIPDASAYASSVPTLTEPALTSLPNPIHTVPVTTSPTPHTMTISLKTGSLKPKSFPDFHLYNVTKHPLILLHSMLKDNEPSCYTTVAGDPRWREAMRHEFEALVSNGTWTLCPRFGSHNIIKNKWVYKIKQRPDGSIERFKAQLVAKGFQPQCGIDYTETFSPVTKPSTIRIVLALAVHFGWATRQLDVSNAFLHGFFAEEVFMEQPQRFPDKAHTNFVCKLHKAIYGLKQAPRVWFHRLSTFLLEIGFTASLVDSSLFLYLHGDIKLFMLIYVDDIIVTGNDSRLIGLLISQFQ
jgi:hypothetical protein